MTRSATWIEYGSVNVVRGVTMRSERTPATVTSLNVEPGSYTSVTARFRVTAERRRAEVVRVEARRVRHREHVAAPRVEDDRGRALRVPLR